MMRSHRSAPLLLLASLAALFASPLVARAQGPTTADFDRWRDQWFSAPAGSTAEQASADSIAALVHGLLGADAVEAFQDYLEAPLGSPAESEASGRVHEIARRAGIREERADELLAMYFVVDPGAVDVRGDKADVPVGDTVFLRTARPGVFRPVTGRVTEVSRTRLRLQTDSVNLLLRPSAVGWVILNRSDPGDFQSYIQRNRDNGILEAYWNKDRTVPIAMVQALPVIGGPLATLDQLSPIAGNLIATILLLGAIAWGVYQLYQAVVVSRRQRQLSRVKLALEVARTRYEALDLSSTHGDDREIRALRELVIPVLEEALERAPAGADVTVRGEAEVQASEPPKWLRSLARATLMGRARFDRKWRSYQTDWRARARRASGNPGRALFFKKAGRALGMFFLGLYGFGFFATAFVQATGYPGGMGLVLFQLVLGVGLLLGMLQTYISYKLVDLAYESVFATPDARAAAPAPT